MEVKLEMVRQMRAGRRCGRSPGREIMVAAATAAVVGRAGMVHLLSIETLEEQGMWGGCEG